MAKVRKNSKVEEKVQPKKEVKRVQKVSETQTVSVAQPSNNTQRVELLMYDEYNQSSILGNSVKVEDLFTQAEKFITSANVENALAASEKDKSWEVFFPVFLNKKGEVDSSKLYAGNKRNGKHYYYENLNGKYTLLELDSSNKNRESVRFLIGFLDNPKGKERWLLKTPRGQEVVSFDDENLQGKSVLFFKVV